MYGYGGDSGYQEDASGLKLLGYRYYDSATGRFLTSDPIGDGPNWYSYCGNNPVSNVDPSGLKLTIRGGTDDERAMVMMIILALGTTKEGRALVQELLYGKEEYIIELSRSKSDGSTRGSVTDDTGHRGHYIRIDLDQVENETLWGTDGKVFPITLARALAHEIIHLIKFPGPPQPNEDVVIGLENSIMNELGEKYVRDPLSHGKASPNKSAPGLLTGPFLIPRVGAPGLISQGVKW
jgi:RHS repeat-associated protein